MRSKPSIAIIGPGKLGGALAVALHLAGYPIQEIVAGPSRNSRARAKKLAVRVRAEVSSLAKFRPAARVIWFCVPDGAIESCARKVAERVSWKDRIALHSSGALASDALHVLRQRGAAVASLHPMMTFVGGPEQKLEGIPFTVEGDAEAVKVARRIAADLKARVYRIAKEDKAAYHAWGSFASPLLVGLLAVAERVAATAGVSPAAARKRMLPIVRQTVENYAQRGAGGAFSGPIVRGDSATMEKHLRALQDIPQAREVYLALARSALHTLPLRNRKKLERVMKAK